MTKEKLYLTGNHDSREKLSIKAVENHGMTDEMAENETELDGFDNAVYVPISEIDDAEHSHEHNHHHHHKTDADAAVGNDDVAVANACGCNGDASGGAGNVVMRNPKAIRASNSPLDEAAAYSLDRIRAHFLTFTKGKDNIGFKEFKDALGKMKGSFFAERFFTYMDKEKRGFISMDELLAGASVLLNGAEDEKMEFIFRLYDVNDDGYITRDDLHQVLEACVAESNMHFSYANLAILRDELFKEADVDRDGKISQRDLQNLLDSYPDILEGVTLSAANWLQPSFETSSSSKESSRFTKNYFKNNWTKLCFILVFILLNCAFFALNSYLHSDKNGWLILARGCGMCLDFCSALVILLPLRMCLSYLRSTWFVNILPLDHNVFLHKLVGWTIVGWSGIHTVGHIGNAVLLSESTNFTVPEIVFTTKADIGWVAGLAPLTGVILVVIILLMFIMSLPFVRRSGYFEVFFWSHKLYVPFYIVCILHATHFWKWVIASCTIFVVESVISYVNRHRGGFSIRSVAILPSGVTQLEINRTPDFNFKAGDYVYIKIPAIAKYEWHPFTISSAPEQKDTFWVHIRSAGHWTKQVREYFLAMPLLGPDGKPLGRKFDKRGRRPSSLSWFNKKTSVAKARAASIRNRAIEKPTNEKVLVDGPYGTACRTVFDTEHAILIGGGIGVTPFASILQSICFRFKAAMVACPECGKSFYVERLRGMNLKKVDFVWINRDQRHFEWFATMLASLERGQSSELKDALTMHMFMTGAPNRYQMQGAGVQVALDIVHTKQQTDMITGLNTRTQPGRPDLNKLLTEIKESSKGLRMKVFFCGSPALGKTIRQKCDQYGIPFSKEQF